MSVAIQAVKFGMSDRTDSVKTLTSLTKEILIRSLVQTVADCDGGIVWKCHELLKLKSSMKNLPPNISDELFKSIFVSKSKRRNTVSLTA